MIAPLRTVDWNVEVRNELHPVFVFSITTTSIEVMNVFWQYQLYCFGCPFQLLTGALGVTIMVIRSFGPSVLEL